MKKLIAKIKHKIFNPWRVRSMKLKHDPPKILLGTYVHRYKHYSFVRWLEHCIDAANDYAGDFKNRVLIRIVDNTEGHEYAAYLRLVCDKVLRERPLKCGDLEVLHLEQNYPNTREKQRASQKVLWDLTASLNCRYLFLVESDLYIPKNSIIELMKYDKPVVSGLYTLKNPETYKAHKEALEKAGELKNWKDEEIGDYLCFIPYMLKFGADGKPGRFLAHRRELKAMLDKVHDFEYGNVVRVFASGIGFHLIRRDVLLKVTPQTTTDDDLAFHREILECARNAKVKYNISDISVIQNLEMTLESLSSIVEKKIHPDTNFHINCEKKGIPRYVNPYLEAYHDRSDWGTIPIER